MAERNKSEDDAIYTVLGLGVLAGAGIAALIGLLALEKYIDDKMSVEEEREELALQPSYYSTCSLHEDSEECSSCKNCIECRGGIGSESDNWCKECNDEFWFGGDD
jgi:hypothetical protein